MSGGTRCVCGRPAAGLASPGSRLTWPSSARQQNCPLTAPASRAEHFPHPCAKHAALQAPGPIPPPHPPCAPSPGSHSAQETHSLQDPFSRALGPSASVQQGWTRSLECEAHKSWPHGGDSGGGGSLHPCEYLLDP